MPYGVTPEMLEAWGPVIFDLGQQIGNLNAGTIISCEFQGRLHLLHSLFRGLGFAAGRARMVALAVVVDVPGAALELQGGSADQTMRSPAASRIASR